MRIQTILELIDTQITAKNFKGQFLYPEKESNTDRTIGSGMYSTVQKHRTDPHMVVKRHHGPTTPADDGYIDFANYIISNKLTDNPHFPRIYNVKKYTDNSNKKIYKYELEKLESLDDLRPSEIKTLINMSLHQTIHDGHYKQEFAKTIQDAVDTRDVSKIKNESLKDAIKHLNTYINHMHKTGSVPFNDIHAGNIMIRRNRFGITPVITDPFA